MYETGAKLRQARQAAGISLAGMARLVNFSKSYLGLVETGRRAATGDVVRAYEKAIGEDLNRRALLLGAASAAVAATLPDVAVDVIRDIAAGRSRLLSTAQTTHDTDLVIGSLVGRNAPSLASLVSWMGKGSPVLRVKHWHSREGRLTDTRRSCCAGIESRRGVSAPVSDRGGESGARHAVG